MTARHVFVLCAPGAESTLKHEVDARQLGWAASYQRPGFVTFRRDDDGDALPELVWGREVSASLGKIALPVANDEAVAAFRGKVGPAARWRVSASVPTNAAIARELAARIGAVGEGELAPDALPRDGDRVIEIVVTTPTEAWIGAHVHDATHARHPGGVWPEREDVPSRAHGKLEAVLDWSGLEPRSGERAIELGSAPGGAALALLERGLVVTGIDPADMDPRVLAHRGFTHLRGSINVLPIDLLPARAEWLIADMNVKPRLTLRAARRVLDALDQPPRALVLTMKLEKWAVAEQLPAWMKTVAEWGYRDVGAKQLSPHRQEVALVAALDALPRNLRS